MRFVIVESRTRVGLPDTVNRRPPLNNILEYRIIVVVSDVIKEYLVTVLENDTKVSWLKFGNLYEATWFQYGKYGVKVTGLKYRSWPESVWREA